MPRADAQSVRRLMFRIQNSKFINSPSPSGKDGGGLIFLTMFNYSRNLITFILLYLCMGTAAMAFEDGQVVRLMRGGYSLLVENSSLDAGKNALLWTETNTHSQRWMLVQKTNGTFYLQNVYSQLYLGGISAAVNNSVVGQIAKANINSRGSWELVPVEGAEGKYNIFIGTARKYALSSVADITDGTGVTLLTASTADPALIEWTVEVDNEAEPYGFSKSMRDDMMNKFNSRHYRKQSTGYSIDNGGWWGDAEMFETILDAYETTGKEEYATMFENLYTNFIARNKSTWYQKGVDGYNEYNDDIAWMCIACTRAYLLTGTTKYLTTARNNFNGMFKRADCYGNDLLQWKHGSGQGTNACINGPAAVCACYLAIATADMSYYEKARKTYMANRGLLYEFSGGKPTGKVWDSYDQGSKSYNYWASTYNQGTSLGAAIMLYNYYQDPMFKSDADAIIKWTLQDMADSHGIIKVCQTVRGDLCGFKGILMRYIRKYAEDMEQPQYYEWLARNAYHAWNNRNSSGITSSAWLTKAEEDFRHKEGDEYKTFESFGNSTCLSAAFNAHLGAVDRHDGFETIQVEDFNFIKNAFIQDSGNPDDGTGMAYNMRNTNNVGYRNVDFGTRFANKITVRANLLRSAGRLYVYADAPDTKKGTLLCTISGTNEDVTVNQWGTYTRTLNVPVTGNRSIYLVAAGTSNVNLASANWFRFDTDLSVYGDMTNNGGTLSTSLQVTDGTLGDLTDDDLLTGFTGTADDASEVYVQYRSSAPVLLQGYSLSAGLQENDPVGWTLMGSDDGNAWTVLHTQENVTVAARAQQMRYDVASSVPYIYYRLSFTLPEGKSALSLSEWQLLGRGISQADITADGGSITEGLESLTDHVGETAVSTPFTAVYKSNGNYTLTAYSVTGTAGQAPDAWTLEGSVNGTTWKAIDQQADVNFPYPGSTVVCRVKDVPAYQYFRLKVQQEGAEAAQWQLFGGYDYGTFYADVTSFPIISDQKNLTDNRGDTYSTVQGPFMQWDFLMPVPVRVLGFSMLSADDAALDPANVSLYGIDEEGNKSLISTRNVTFSARAGRATATISSTQVFRQFQLVVNETASGGNVCRLAEFELFGTAIEDVLERGMLMLPAAVTASADALSTSEAVEKISDRSRTTRYRANFTEPVSITYSYDSPVPIHCYTVTAAKNGVTNDPKDWVLEASLDGNNWEVLDRRAGEVFSNRYATQVYMLPEQTEPVAYSQYRLTVSAVNGGSQLHIGELQLLYLEPCEDDEMPVVDLVEQKNSSAEGVYSLSGQLMGTSLRQVFNSLPKGIYIVGGKKIQKK